MANVIEHGNGKRVPEEAVRKVKEPKFTETWHPVSHAKVLDALQVAVKDQGLIVKGSSYSLAAEGQNMFGTWSLDNGDADAKIGWELGFRNSVRKSYAIGVTAGTNVFVCSNLMFSGEFLEFRRHTKQVDMDELKLVAGRAIGMLVEKIKYQVAWQEYLRDFPLKEQEYKIMTFNAMREGVFSPSNFNSFVKCWQEEVALEESSLYTFHGAVTRLYRDRGLFQIAEQTGILKGFADDYMDSVAA